MRVILKLTLLSLFQDLRIKPMNINLWSFNHLVGFTPSWTLGMAWKKKSNSCLGWDSPAPCTKSGNGNLLGTYDWTNCWENVTYVRLNNEVAILEGSLQNMKKQKKLWNPVSSYAILSCNFLRVTTHFTVGQTAKGESMVGMIESPPWCWCCN